MKKGIIVLGLLVGTAVIVSANGYGRDNTERQRQNIVDAQDCTLEETGSGYLNEDNRNYQNRDESSTGERQRQNVVDPEDCTLEGDEAGTGYLNEDGRNYQNQNNSKGRGKNRK